MSSILFDIPESDLGNKEYKLFLNEERIEHLSNQMRFRINEGSGEAIYTLGITDDGGLVGLNEDDYIKNTSILSKICEMNNYSFTEILNRKGVDGKIVYTYLIREKISDKYVNIRIAIGGSVDAGKSSTLGVLTFGKLDDGKGSARTNIFNFKHEIDTGRSSSIAHHILGFDENGTITNVDEKNRQRSWKDIVNKSTKVISFYDLCGHEKYFKTTINGLTSFEPHLCLILVGANMGLTEITKSHIISCVLLSIPIAIVISKIDLCETSPQIIDNTYSNIKKFLKRVEIGCTHYKIQSREDVLTVIQKPELTPIFFTSNKKNIGLNYLKSFLNLKNFKNYKKDNSPVEMYVDHIYNVQGIGTVLAGHLYSGTIKIGDKLYIGPNTGLYETVIVKSIHCKQVNVSSVSSGMYVCIAIKKPLFPIKKGNVLVSENPYQVVEFDANISILPTHSTTVKIGYSPVLNARAIRQSVYIIKIVKDNEEVKSLSTGDSAIVKFRFAHYPCYISDNTDIILTEGSLKIFGKITNVIKDSIKIV